MSETHGIPSDHHSHVAPAPPEPKTPMWLPGLGAVLFLLVGLLWALAPASKNAGDSAGGAGNPAADAGAPGHP